MKSILTVAVLLGCIVTQALGGSIFLTGHDPDFHAVIGEFEILVSISTFEVLQGSMRRKDLEKVFKSPDVKAPSQVASASVVSVEPSLLRK